MKIIIAVVFASHSVNAFLCSQNSSNLNGDSLIDGCLDGERNHEGTVRIIIDDDHNNLHTINNALEPMVNILRNHGFNVASSNSDNNTIDLANLLIIINPLHHNNIGQWRRPIHSAFSQLEINQIESWVANGGNLLVVADHMPYAGATNKLANAFGFQYIDGFVMSENSTWPPDYYSKDDGTLYESEVTNGIDFLAGYTGSALKAPNSATVIAHFPPSHRILIPEIAWEFNEITEVKPVSGYVQGAYMNYKQGKVAFLTEAAMFTEQVLNNNLQVGFNSPSAIHNKQFFLNLIQWLVKEKE